VKIPVRALLTALVCLAIAWAWQRTGERQELASRLAFVHTLLDGGQLRIADALAQRLAADFPDAAASGPLRATTQALVEANLLLQQKRAADARARLAPLAAQPDAPAAAHFLLGRALIQLGDATGGNAEKAKARELAPDAPLFREATPKEAAPKEAPPKDRPGNG
jgi:hypothetical protein